MNITEHFSDGQIRALLYPLGYLSTIAFGARFLIQWIASEKAKRSLSIPLFWKLSMIGNILLSIHSVIQIHFPMCLMQSLQTVLSWRNLNLLKAKESQKPLKDVFLALALVTCSVTFIFFVQGYWIEGNDIFIQAPYSRGIHREPLAVSPWTHAIGILGICAFSFRFLYQWWQAELAKKSEFTEPFWWISIFGATLSLIYFLRLLDFVNLIGPAFAIIPYVRNLILTKRSSRADLTPDKSCYFIIAGEKSASVYGKELILELKKRNPSLTFYGCGGEEMTEVGLIQVTAYRNFQVMGLTSVIKKLPLLIYSFYTLKKAVFAKRASAVICIDQPSFSLRFAHALRKDGYREKIIQYVAPTVWAYKKERAEQMAKDFSLILTLFPFEASYFAGTGLHSVFTGHPLVSKINSLPTSVVISKTFISLFPGSRKAEIEANLPTQLLAAIAIAPIKKLTIAISYVSIELLGTTTSICKKMGIDIRNITFIPFDRRYSLMQESALSIAKSGTVTLELALFATPTVVIYKLSLLNYLFAKYIYKLKLPFYCITNILLKREVYPEFIGRKIDLNTVIQSLDLMSTTEMKSSCIRASKELRLLLLDKNQPSEIAAEAVLELTQ